MPRISSLAFASIALAAVAGLSSAASAGPDTPYGGTIGTTRVYALTGDTKTLSPDAWFDALRDGRTFVTNGPMLEFSVQGKDPGALLEIDQPRDLFDRHGEIRVAEQNEVSLGREHPRAHRAGLAPVGLL